MMEDLPDSPRRRIVGTKQVLRAAASGNTLEFVCIASDIQTDLKETIEKACKRSGIAYEVSSNTKAQLGEICGLSVAAACYAVVNEEKSVR